MQVLYYKINYIFQMADIEIMILKRNKKLYKCSECDKISKRRFNIQRHHWRFHRLLDLPKTCCGK